MDSCRICNRLACDNSKPVLNNVAKEVNLEITSPLRLLSYRSGTPTADCLNQIWGTNADQDLILSPHRAPGNRQQSGLNGKANVGLKMRRMAHDGGTTLLKIF